MIEVLKWLQLAVSIGVIALFWRIYPGVMVVLATAAGLCYVASAVVAFRNYRVAIWLAFAFSALTAIFATLSVRRYIQNGFDFLAGNFVGHSGIDLTPYVFLLISLTSMLVVVMHVAAWRWTLWGRPQGAKGACT